MLRKTVYAPIFLNLHRSIMHYFNERKNEENVLSKEYFEQHRSNRRLAAAADKDKQHGIAKRLYVCRKGLLLLFSRSYLFICDTFSISITRGVKVMMVYSPIFGKKSLGQLTEQ